MAHTNVVTNELNKIGFVAQGNAGKVFVSLSSRKVSTMEVQTALSQIFDEIKFQTLSTSNGVLVSW